MAMQAVGFADGRLRLLDQRELPHAERILEIETAAQACDAIRDMAVRGAPAIGLAAAFAMALAAREAARAGHPRQKLEALAEMIATARPTAVNLRHEVDAALENLSGAPESWFEEAVRHAEAMRERQLAEDEAMARNALPLFRPGMRVLTHCNTGALATGGHGTALAAIVEAHRQFGLKEVLADETRPRLQGARLTAFELSLAGVPHRVIVDGAAAYCMAQGMVNLVIVGADRIGSDGRVANKIGTYGLAVLARHHGIPFAVVAPRSSCDPLWPGASEVEIEQRDPREVLEFAGQRVASAGSDALNPAFDVTPGDLVAAIVREDGLFRPPFAF